MIIWLLGKKRDKKVKWTWLVVLFSEGSESSIQSDQSHSDRKWKFLKHLDTYGEIIFELVSSMEQSGTKCAAPSYQTLQRFLAQTPTVKAPTTCDELCKGKSSLLEGNRSAYYLDQWTVL
ncbi:hypothetical protein YC2023_076109 [Brassica napus]